MKRFLILWLIALPLQAEVRAGARAGIFTSSSHDVVGGIELDVRGAAWSFAPAYEYVRGGGGVSAAHVNVRRLFRSNDKVFWAGIGPTFVRSNTPANDTTFNVDTGVEWRTKTPWSPFIAARYFSYSMPVFRGSAENRGVVISVGVSRRLRE